LENDVMRITNVRLWACLFATCTGLAQEELSPSTGKKAAADEKAVAVLIRQLGDDSFAKRDAANRALAEIGAPALPLLRKAVIEGSDLEVRKRASKLIRTFAARPGAGVLLPGATVGELVISKDGKTIAFGCANKIVSVYDFETMTLRHTLRGHTSRVFPIAISPDGRTLASGAGAFADTKFYEIILWDLGKGIALRTLKGDEGPSNGLAFSLDGTHLYSAGFDGAVRVWDVASGKEIGVLTGHEGWVRGVHSTPDGKLIISCGIDSTVRFWDRKSLKEERRIVTRHAGIGPSSLSPDGKWLITGSRPMGPPDPGVITVWDVATGKEKTTIKGPTRKVNALAVSPDSTLLAMGGGLTSQMGEVKIFDLMTGKELVAFPDHNEWVEGLAFSPDGNWLASGSGAEFGTAAEIRIWDVRKRRGKGE
jgi:WD40 repeat protein